MRTPLPDPRVADTATSGATQSSWLGTQPVPDFPALNADAEADVAVIGAGIAGLTTAYLLAAEGRRVVVLDDGAVASGESGRTTGHLTNALDEGFAYLEKLFGEAGTQVAAQAHGRAIDKIEEICRTEGIACDFQRLSGYLFADASRSPAEMTAELTEELAAAQRAGLTGLTLQPESGQAGVQWPGPCLVFPQQAQFHVTKYLTGLAHAIGQRGGKVYAHSHVADVSRDGAALAVHLSRGPVVRARHVVVATNTPFLNRVVMHTKQAPYRTYVVALQVPKGAVAPGLYWDTADPYHYVRLQTLDGPAAHDLLLVGGEDHKVGQEMGGLHDANPAHRFATLETWARQHFAPVGTVAYTWSGQVLEPVDGLGYAGRNPLDDDEVYLITGDSGHGLTHGTLGALLITDLIERRSNPWAHLFDPGRITLQLDALKEFVRENANVATEYAELVTGGDVASADEILPGQGAVLRRGLTKVAAWRDPAGQLHECSAICPHLGCVVAWNGLEQSWDCPCHGSRFDALGHLLAGPANTGLAPLS